MTFRLIDLVNDYVGDAFPKINEALTWLLENKAGSEDSKFTMNVQRERVLDGEVVNVNPEEQLALYDQLIVEGDVILEGSLRVL